MNPIIHCLDGLFVLLHNLLLDTIDKPEELKHQTRAALLKFELLATEKSIDLLMLNKIKYAIVALIDELAAKQFKSAWLNNPLQLELFGELIAGEKFFQELLHMRLNAEQMIDGLEVYYLILELGYQGQYQHNDQPELLRIKSELLAQIQSIRKLSDQSLWIKTNQEQKTTIERSTSISLKRTTLFVGSAILFIAIGLMGLSRYNTLLAQQKITLTQLQEAPHEH